MKRKITILTAALALLAFLTVPMGMRGQTREVETFTFSELGYANGDTVATVEGEDVTLTFAQGTNSTNAPKYYSTGTGVRMYTGNTLDVALNNQEGETRITAINFTFSGTYTGSLQNWTGSETSVSFTNTASGQARIQVIAVTFSEGGVAPTTYTVTYNANVTGVAPVVDTYAEGATVTLRGADTFTNEGFTFEEWNTDANGDGDAYSAGDVIENIDDNITLYAIWTENTTPTPGGETATLNIQAYATANNWVNGTKYTTATVDPVTFTANGGSNTGKYYTSGQEWRYYQGENASITISVPEGYTLVSVTPTYNVNNGGVLKNGDTTIASGTTVDVTGTSATFTVGNSGTATNGQVRFTNIDVVYVSEGGVIPPSITAANVEIAYDATSGSIAYTINNEPDPAGMLTASTESDWLTLSEVGENVPFTCAANASGTERTATVTLTYTYNRETVSKDVTVTQAGDPNATMTIAEVRAQGTGSVVTKGTITSISGNGTKTAYIQDATAAIVVYGSFTAAVGDEIRVSGTLTTYQGLMEITNPTVTVISQGNTIDPELMTIAEINASTNQGWYIRVEDATVTAISSQNTTIAQGDNTILVYGNLGVTVEVNDIVSLNGNIGNHNGVQITNPQNVEVQVAPAVPSITVTPATVNLDAGEHYMNLLDLTYENIEVEGTDSFTVHYYNAEGEEIELVQGEAWLVAGVVQQDDVYQVLFAVVANYGEARTAYFKVSCGETYSNLVTVTQAAPVLDYAVLPFVWEGGERSAFEALNGTSTYGVGDYAATQGVYRMKLDNNGDYIMVKTNGQPGLVTIGVKMVGGSNTSTITIQGSADGETFTDIEELTISGAQNDTLTLETTNVFDANDRYVRMFFTRGSNVGVGPITIAKGTAPSINIAPANFDLEAVGDLNGMQVASGFVTYNNIDITQASDFHIQFYDAEGVEQDQPEWILGTAVSLIANSYQAACMVGPNTGAARSTYYKIYAFDADSIPVYSNLVTINQAGVPQPSITITPDNFELDANSHMAEVLAPITYQNIVVVSGSGNETFDVQYYDAEGHEIEQTWCSVGAAANGDTDFNLIIVAGVNEGNEARTAYFKLYAHDADSNLVYSNLVTVTQAAPVIDYAVLPFVWEGGSSADFAALNGVTLSGNGSDYNSNHSPYLIKLDGTGDYIQVKTDSQPGTVTIGVKMVGGSNTSTITIQGSADGETFTDIEVLTISGAQNDTLTLETTNAFADADRYVRMLFTKGSNVGVGPITIASGSASSITVTPATLNLEATGSGQNGVQMQQFVVTYHNLDIEGHSDFTVQFYDAEGEEQEQPTWITPNPAYVAGGNDEGYMVMLFIEGNTGVARSAYFKVSALDADENVVYSNLVTINQAGAPQQYTLTVEPFENLELITFVNDEMVMEGDGEITVTEGNQVMLSIVAMEGYVMETLMVNGVNHVNDIADDFTYTFEMPAENVTISATAVEDVPPTPGEWVMVRLNDLTENDVFVIVGVYDEDESSFAMPNNGSGAPSAVAVTMVGNTLSGDIAENLKWNLSIGEDGYTFYPNGETESWLYCINSNNGVRVGTNENNVFTMTPEGYLYNNATSRYIGIYNRQDWRCYTTIHTNIKDQTFAFYKRVDEGSLVTYTLDIEGYGSDSIGGYYLIASPVSMIRPTAENGFLTEAYDLYYFDQAQNDYEWRNYKAKHFNIASGKGYLYASQENTTLTFTGVPYNGNGEIVLDQAGWNLIGNPYNTSATVNRDFYRLNADGSELELSETSEVNKMQGIFVEAQNENEVVLFDAGMGTFGDTEMKLNLRVNGNNGSSDFARIRFGEGSTLGKFMFNANNTKLYFTQDSEEFAVVRSSNENEMPVSFKAATNGIYTFSVNAENMEVDYLHLIDNMTGADIDLLDTPSYSFEANTSDYTQRFRLVFATTNGINESADIFAFFNGSEWVISNMGKATLQMVDMTGRILSSETINGCATISTDNLSAGIYMMRLVNGNNVKVQKVVVR